MKRVCGVIVLVAMALLPLGAFAQEKPAPGDLISDAELKEMTRTISRNVEQIRGLSFGKPVQEGIKSRKELRDFIVEQMREEMPKERILAYEKTLIAFGLLPPGTDFEKTILDFLTDNIGGFYDHKSKRLFLIRDIARALQRVALSHELTHALQDEYFDLKKMPLDDKTNDDLALAALSVVEGDAMEVMYKYVQEVALRDPALVADLAKMADMAMKETESFQKAPLYLRRDLLFPYLNGLTFVNHLIGIGGAARRNDVFRLLPTSSEQILHPEKYTGQRDDPTFLRLPDLAPALGADWTHVMSNVMGELNVQVLCEQFGLAPAASITASGWDGDQYAAYECAGTKQIFLAWITTWDSETDAREFFDVYRAVLMNKHKDASLVESDVSALWMWNTGSGYVLIERKGSDVLVLDGFPAGKSPALKAAAWGFERSSKPFPEARRAADPPRTAKPVPEETTEAPARVRVDRKQMDKAFDDVGKQLGVKPEDLKTMTEQFMGPRTKTGRTVGSRFIDEAKGFEIAHPPGWTFVAEGDIPMVSLAMTDKTGMAIVTMVTFPFGMEPVEMWMPMMEGMYSMQFQQFTKVRSGRTTVGSLQAYEILFTGSKDGAAMKVRQIVVATPAMTYVLMCAAPAKDYEAKAGDFEKIVGSLRITAPAQQKPASPGEKARKPVPAPAPR